MTTKDDRTPAIYSPGPYVCEFDRDGCDDLIFIVAADGTHVAQIHYWDCDEASSTRARANAALLKAAPKLLNTVKALLISIGTLPVTSLDGDLFDAIYSARSVLASIQGGQS